MTKRFFDKLVRVNECLEYQGARDKDGYCRISINGQMWAAHRYAWTLANGVIPDGLFVCHKCDNPCCCNTDHLFVGTHKDNMKDMVRKGRSARPVGSKHSNHARGEASGKSKLTEKDVLAIRSSPKSLSAVAKEFGICKMNAWHIRQRRTWKHI